MKILLVDDSTTERFLVGETLTRRGHEVHIATRLSEAYDWLKKNGSPDAVVLDVIMPDWTSIDDTLQLSKAFDCRVVIHTAHSYMEYLDIMRAEGYAVVEKSYECERLLKALR